MLKKLPFRLIAVIAALCAVGSLARAEDSPWQSDFAAAKSQAKSEKKLLLVDFTGSDWCIWCQKLKKEVFDKEPFLADAPKQFVLVELDFPRAKKLSDDVKKQNAKLAKEYKIHGYPTILILDDEGKLIAHTGYQPGGAEKYAKHLTELVDTYHSVEKMRGELASAKSLDRAKLLDKLIDAYGKLDNEVADIPAWSKEIIALDSDNEAGLKTKQQARLWIAELDHVKPGQKAEAASEIVDKILALPGVTGQQKQDAYFALGQVYFNHHNLNGVVDSLTKAVAADPKGSKADQIKPMIARFDAMAKAEKEAKLKAEKEAKLKADADSKSTDSKESKGHQTSSQ